jgi:putative tryptophan/tyrosine transport system substrate-binding protein
MRRRAFLSLAGAAAAWPLSTSALQAKRIPTVGLLLPPPRNSDVDEFFAGMGDLGWVDGQNVHIEYRDAGGDESRLPALAAELVALDVDVIAAGGNGVVAAHRATTTIPIVSIAFGDLIVLGLAQSLSHPGGNLTGQFSFAPQVMGKRVEFLKTVAPSVTSAGFLTVRGFQFNAASMIAIEEGAQALKMSARPIEVGGLDEIESALSAVSGAIGGVVISDHAIFVTNPDVVAGVVQKLRMPSVSAPVIAAHGGLLGYGVVYAAMFRHAPVFVDKILKGAKPGDIPIEGPTKYKTAVNLKTANALGLEIPPTLLASADEMIE